MFIVHSWVGELADLSWSCLSLGLGQRLDSSLRMFLILGLRLKDGGFLGHSFPQAGSGTEEKFTMALEMLRSLEANVNSGRGAGQVWDASQQ